MAVCPETTLFLVIEGIEKRKLPIKIRCSQKSNIGVGIEDESRDDMGAGIAVGQFFATVAIEHVSGEVPK
jgi:hypothetical protein